MVMLADEPIGVFNEASLAGSVRIGKTDVGTRIAGHARVIGRRGLDLTKDVNLALRFSGDNLEASDG
jgi:hypothetical protein